MKPQAGWGPHLGSLPTLPSFPTTFPLLTEENELNRLNGVTDLVSVFDNLL
jgi:hypothetical protein